MVRGANDIVAAQGPAELAALFRDAAGSKWLRPPWQCSSSLLRLSCALPAPPQGAARLLPPCQLDAPRRRSAHWAPSHRLGGSSQPPLKLLYKAAEFTELLCKLTIVPGDARLVEHTEGHRPLPADSAAADALVVVVRDFVLERCPA